jgi:hypothetical protein
LEKKKAQRFNVLRQKQLGQYPEVCVGATSGGAAPQELLETFAGDPAMGERTDDGRASMTEEICSIPLIPFGYVSSSLIVGAAICTASVLLIRAKLFGELTYANSPRLKLIS